MEGVTDALNTSDYHHHHHHHHYYYYYQNGQSQQPAAAAAAGYDDYDDATHISVLSPSATVSSHCSTFCRPYLSSSLVDLVSIEMDRLTVS